MPEAGRRAAALPADLRAGPDGQAAVLGCAVSKRKPRPGVSGKPSPRERGQAERAGRTEKVTCPARGRHDGSCMCSGTGKITVHR